MASKRLPLSVLSMRCRPSNLWGTTDAAIAFYIFVVPQGDLNVAYALVMTYFLSCESFIHFLILNHILQ